MTVMGLRFFSTHTLPRSFANLPLPKRTKTLPVVFSREEVARLLANTATLRERALLMTTYGGGLRVREVGRLRVKDIDAQRDMLRIEQIHLLSYCWKIERAFQSGDVRIGDVDDLQTAELIEEVEGVTADLPDVGFHDRASGRG